MQNKYYRVPIPGYENNYEIDINGKVYSLTRYVQYKDKVKLRKGLCLKTRIDQKGYEMVNLNQKCKVQTIRIHRLMGFAFLGLTPDMEINHIDANKLNNKLSNLEVCTGTENKKHAFKLGLVQRSSVDGRFEKSRSPQ